MSQTTDSVGAGGDPIVRHRRTSILSQNAAKEGFQLQANNDLFKRLSNSFQQSVGGVGRLSNNNGPQRLQQGSSLIPTPSSNIRVPPPAGLKYSKGGLSSIPRSNGLNPRSMNPPLSSLKKPIFAPTNATSAQSSRSFMQPRQTLTGTRQPPSKPNQSARSAVGGKFPLRKSSSIDSHQWSLNSMMTPSTPGRSIMSKSPTSMRKWGSQVDLGSNNSNCVVKIPSTTNKEGKDIVNTMCLRVIDFLMTHNYPNVPSTARDMSKITTTQFFNMIQFAASFLVDPKFFKGADLPSKVLELIALLKYPAPLSKSHLKSATAPNSWPACITFLTWLCIRVEGFTQMEIKCNPMDAFKNDGFLQIAMDNLLQVFFVERQTINLSDEERNNRLCDVMTDELAAFQNKVSEMFMSEVEWTTQELMEQKETKLKELAEIEAIPDPSKDTSEALELTKNKLTEMKKKIEDTKSRIKTYQDMNSLRNKMESTKLEIKSRKVEIESVKAEISAQLLDKQGEKKLITETEEMGKQRECLNKMLNTLRRDLEKKKQAKNNVDDRLLQTITQFTVVQTFNAYLSSLSLNELSLAANPLTTEDLNGWLDVVEKTHEKAIKAVEEIITLGKNDQRAVEQKESRITNEISQQMKALEKNDRDVQDIINRINAQQSDGEKKMQEIESKFTELCSVVSTKRQEHLDSCKEIEELEEDMKAYDNLIVKRNNTLEEWEVYAKKWSESICYLKTGVGTALCEDMKTIIEKSNAYVARKLAFNEEYSNHTK